VSTRAAVSALIASLVSVTAALVLLAAPSWADGGGACPPADPNCVTVGTGSPGSPGGGSHDPPGNGGGTQTDPCTVDPNSSACAAENQARMCSAIAADWAGGSRTGGPIGTLNNLSPAL
jgi:hypothetical protein